MREKINVYEMDWSDLLYLRTLLKLEGIKYEYVEKECSNSEFTMRYIELDVKDNRLHIERFNDEDSYYVRGKFLKKHLELETLVNFIKELSL